MLNVLHISTEPTRPETATLYEDQPGYFILCLPVDNMISLTDLTNDAIHYIESFGPYWLLNLAGPMMSSEIKYAIYAAAPSWLHIDAVESAESPDSFAWFLISLEQ
jgi:hypothetical protein